MCVTRELKCIIVAPDESFRACSEKLLHSFNKGNTDFVFESSISSLINILKTEVIDLAIIELHEIDYDELDKLIELDDITASILLITDRDNYLELFRRTYSKGFLVMPRPVTVNTFLQALQIGLNASDKMKLDPNNYKKITDIRFLDVAKLLLVLNEKMSEEQAHRYVEKLSMDLRVAKLKSAEYVINRYVKC